MEHIFRRFLTGHSVNTIKQNHKSLKFRSINVKIHVVDLHVLFLEFLITQRLFIKWDNIWIPKVEKIKDLLTMATFLE